MASLFEKLNQDGDPAVMVMSLIIIFTAILILIVNRIRKTIHSSNTAKTGSAEIAPAVSVINEPVIAAITAAVNKYRQTNIINQ